MRENIAKNLCKVIALANQKGGVAKSFTTASLAVGLVNSGNRVLVIDNDPQGHASRCLGVRKPEKTIYDIMEKLVKGEEITPNDCMECIVTTDEGVDLLPANVKYAMMELEMSSAMSREHLLNEFVVMQRPFYDFILIDCPPNVGLFVLNALTASDSVLIPVKLEDVSLDGLQQLIQTIGMAKRRLNYNLEIEGILFTIVETNTVLARNSIEAIREAYGEHVHIYDFVIPKSVKAAECPGSGTSIYKYDPNGKVAKAYEVLTKEVLSNV